MHASKLATVASCSSRATAGAIGVSFPFVATIAPSAASQRPAAIPSAAAVVTTSSTAISESTTRPNLLDLPADPNQRP